MKLPDSIRVRNCGGELVLPQYLSGISGGGAFSGTLQTVPHCSAWTGTVLDGQTSEPEPVKTVMCCLLALIELAVVVDFVIRLYRL